MIHYNFLPPTAFTTTVVEGYRDLINAEVGGGIGFTQEATSETARRLMETYTAEGSHLLQVSADGRFIGSGVLSKRKSPVQQHVGDIRKVVVHPDFRGRGLGRGVMENLEAKACEIGLEALVLDVRAHLPAVRLYEGMGYQRIGILKELSKVGSEYFDILIMQKMLGQRDRP